LKYVFEILGKYFVFCILAKFEMYFVFKYKKSVFEYLKYMSIVKYNQQPKSPLKFIRLNYINTIKLIYKQ